MKPKRKSYRNEEWRSFSLRVKHRDNYACLKCGRRESEAVLQTHHTIYKTGLDPWDYPLSDCITLCKGCHAVEHGKVEPDRGWTLISIDDLGDIDGICERRGCGNAIRFEHITYHPGFGYKTVGSTCVEHLTREDQYVSQEVITLFKNISDFVIKTKLRRAVTIKGNPYFYAFYGYHEIRIYENERSYSIQPVLKLKGERWHDYRDFVPTKNKNLSQAVELGYIILKGLTTDSERERNVLRNIYRSIS